MTDKQLAAQADAAFRATTITYQEWQRRLQQGKYPDPSKTKWWQGFDALGQIGATPPPPVDPPPTQTGPVTISKGGTYVLNAVGDTSHPAVSISTTEPVVIKDSVLTNPSRAKPGVKAQPVIDCSYLAVDLTVTNTRFNGGDGRAVDCENQKRLVVTNCSFEQTAGIVAQAGPAGGVISILRNAFHNIRDNGYLLNKPDGGGSPGNAVQLRSVVLPATEIAWNQVLNEYAGTMAQYQAGSGCWPEDLINLWQTSNTHIHNNYFQHHSTPGNGAEEAAGRQEQSSQGTITVDSGSSHNLVEFNQMVSTIYGVVFAAGTSDNLAQFNRLVSAGYLSDGVTKQYYGFGGYMISGGNNNHMHSNVSGWVSGTKYGYGRSDFWFDNGGMTNPTHTQAQENALNTLLPDPITRQTELDEWQAWLAKLDANNVKVGA